MLVGVGVTSPLSSTRRHQLALQVAGYALSSLPLLTRTSAQSARLVFSAMVAAEAPLPPNVSREELGDQPRTLSKAMPRKVRKALPDLVRALPDAGASTETQVRMVQRHTRRLALLLSGDLEAALESVVGALPSADVIGGSEDALDLVRAFTSAPMTTLRKRLGLAR
jgi:siroheme synthase